MILIEECNLVKKWCTELMRLTLNFVFSDETEINGAINRHNCRYWSEWKFTLDEWFLHNIFKIWTYGQEFVVAILLVNFFNFTVERYDNLLRDTITPNVENLLDADMQNIPARWNRAYAIRIREFLNQSFPDRWIREVPLSGLLDHLICFLLIIFFEDISKVRFMRQNHIIWKILGIE